MVRPDLFLPVAITGIVILALIAVVLYLKRSGKWLFAGKKTEKSLYDPPHLPDYQTGETSLPAGHAVAASPALARIAELPDPKGINLIDNRNDLTGSLVALADKYSLAEFTIATIDGLIFASSGKDAAHTDAATYSELYKNDPLAKTPGVTLFGLRHKGSELVGIIRTHNTLPDEILQEITADTKVILNWWI